MAKIFQADWKKFLEQVRGLILSARRAALRSVDTLQVFTNFRIGYLIVEQEQKGRARADYGKQILVKLSQALKAEFGRGFSEDNLSRMRKFYLEYQHIIGRQISAKASRKLPPLLSWSHYVFLMTIGGRKERQFYEIEALQSGWSLPELKRQYNSSLFERLALSRDKENIL